MHRRPVWPWIAALLFVLGAGVGGWFLYSEISNKLNSTKPVAVELYLNMPEAQARVKIKADGFQPLVDHHSSRSTPRGLVFKQVPNAGDHLPKGSQVHIWVSTGLAEGERARSRRAAVDRRGRDVDEAPAEARPAQRPVAEAGGRGDGAGAEGRREADRREPVRLNVSKGPQPVVVPSVIGEPFDQAASELQAKGFRMQPRFVDDNQPANTVIGQSPSAGGHGGQGLGRSRSPSRRARRPRRCRT